jgi:hypothetical protein
MYNNSGNYGRGLEEISGINFIGNPGINLDDFMSSSFTHFRQPVYTSQPLSYRIAQSYIQMFSPVYIGSGLERYILKNSVTNHVNLEYMAALLYHAHSSYNSRFVTTGIIHEPEVFLIPQRPATEFIEHISPALRKKIKLIFRLTTGNELPEDILISILPEQELEREHRKHSSGWSRQIHGFAINRLHLYDFSSIFVKENLLDALMLTIGHEIGHCLSLSKEDAIMEEAKAFAFEIAWMRTIHRFNILELKDCMNINILNPAVNGLHNVALEIVLEKIREGREPIEVFRDIIASG